MRAHHFCKNLVRSKFLWWLSPKRHKGSQSGAKSSSKRVRPTAADFTKAHSVCRTPMRRQADDSSDTTSCAQTTKCCRAAPSKSGREYQAAKHTAAAVRRGPASSNSDRVSTNSVERVALQWLSVVMSLLSFRAALTSPSSIKTCTPKGKAASADHQRRTTYRACHI